MTAAAALSQIAAQMQIHLLRPPWAPGLWLAFGKWQGDVPVLSPLASGSGATAEAARLRALGEMAENLALAPGAHPRPIPVLSADGRMICPDARPEALPDRGSEGCAAHGDPGMARLAAFCECAERAALALWWQGRLDAVPLPLPPLMLRYRHGQHGPRRSRIWSLPMLEGLAIRLAITDDGGGGKPALGSAAAADADIATDAALREAMQAEFALIAPRGHPDQAHLQQLAQRLAPQMSRLDTAPGTTPPLSGHGADLSSLLRILQARGLSHGFADLTHPQLAVPVWRFLCPDWPAARPLLF